jgi:hypothetical protein
LPFEHRPTLFDVKALRKLAKTSLLPIKVDVYIFHPLITLWSFLSNRLKRPALNDPGSATSCYSYRPLGLEKQKDGPIKRLRFKEDLRN